jgi:alkylation response protein AidB-like acyl-CoA dehydrogenase
MRDSRMYIIVEGTTDIQHLILSRQLGLKPQ